MFNMFDEDYDRMRGNNIGDFVEAQYNSVNMSCKECKELLNKINCNSPYETFEIFDYVREKYDEFDSPDKIDFIDKINAFKYFMALDWLKSKELDNLVYKS